MLPFCLVQDDANETPGEACNFTKINTPPLVFISFFKLHKWYQIAQGVSYYDFISLSTRTCAYVS